jgi:hypothetical protein
MTEVQPDLDKTISRCAQRREQGSIVNRGWTPDRITAVLCDEALGF